MRHATVAAFFLVALGGCDQQAAIDQFTPKEEAALAKRVVAQVAAREFSEVEKQLDPALAGPNARSSLEQMAQQFPAATPKSVRTVGAFTNTDTTANLVVYTLTFEYEYPSSWLLAEVVLQRRGADLLVQGIHVKPLQNSLEVSNRFSLAGESIVHYVVLALAITIPVFIIYALVMCFKTPIPKRKWLWYIFVAVGLVQVSLNWTTGAFSVQPVSLLLLGAAFHQAGAVGPLVLSIAIPIGAVVFLARRRSLGVQGVG